MCCGRVDICLAMVAFETYLEEKLSVWSKEIPASPIEANANKWTGGGKSC